MQYSVLSVTSVVIGGRGTLESTEILEVEKLARGFFQAFLENMLEDLSYPTIAI